MFPGAASHLIFLLTQLGLGAFATCSASPAASALLPQVPPGCPGPSCLCTWVVAGAHMLDGSLGFPVSTSGLKATDPLREGPAACRDAETGDCGVDAPTTERLG